MNVEHQHIEIEGHLMHRTIMRPNPNTPERAACIFNHGQGDYGERYLDVLHPFTERGITCIITDQLGHGRSPGNRGHVGNLDFTDKLITSNLAAAGNLPIGIAGHSMGGLLTLRHLTLALQGKLPMPEYCWVNAPLLHPANGRKPWFIKLVRQIARLAPTFTIHTGVTPNMCRQGEEETGKLPKDPAALGHQRVSIRWGIELLKAEVLVQNNLPIFENNIPFLYTQGGEDIVCPPPLAQRFFKKLHLPNKTYQQYPNMRHETFAETEREKLFETIATWLDQNYPADKRASKSIISNQ